MDENAILKNRGCNLPAALDTIVMRNVDVPHKHRDLRLALNARSHYFEGVEEDEEAASVAA